MTKEEIYDIYNEICKIVDGIYLYHDDYLVGSFNWNSDESSLLFTVYGHSDQGDGTEWEEEWAIDRDGKIYDSRTIYNSLEDFKNNWWYRLNKTYFMEDYKKKYEQALERCKKEFNYNNLAYSNIKQKLECVFPELKESEDEKIRKEIIAVFKGQIAFTSVETGKKYIAWLEKHGEKFIPEDINEAALQYVDTCAVDGKVTHGNITEPYWNNHSMMAAYKAGWLESQGKQQPVDKVESKFKVGDWVIRDYSDSHHVNQITGVKQLRSKSYGYELDDGTYFSGYFEKEYHLWTIQDAKDGDVLCYEDELFILKNYVLSHKIVYHCCYDGENFIPHSIYSLTKDDFNNVHPATKEQRDLLFQKIKEAGYEWDADKKELKNKDARENLTLDGDLMQADCMMIEQKSSLNEEDEKMFEYALDMIEWYSGKNENKSRAVSNWLKSLKEKKCCLG